MFGMATMCRCNFDKKPCVVIALGSVGVTCCGRVRKVYFQVEHGGHMFFACTSIIVPPAAALFRFSLVCVDGRPSTTFSLNLPRMGYPGPSLLQALSMVSLAHAGLMHLLFPHSSEAGRPHIDSTKRTAVDNTTLWVIQDTYEGSTFFKYVTCFSIEISCANQVPSQSTFNFYTGPDPTKFVRILREFTSTDVRLLQWTSDVSLDIHESMTRHKTKLLPASSTNRLHSPMA